ncbi:hypothetical protein ATK17_3918 [Branchiibius hedensis]|uniref:HTH cro/C1-type domain-containing protein n=1 Tax=Branchiibius hedensis TaxID=672460 RepID=A0A2Y9BN11_9MICO|nr:helix-turn-helix domain-containing protein [Branchiibius hedensis]PWJ23027.1 hypothetical protein ATK17_3918 [Branchiibius hedensis]SSA59103.1 hypothetical protein SAMN04489750_3918 [Branchiibius hedensis]
MPSSQSSGEIPELVESMEWLRDNIPNDSGWRYTWAEIADGMTEMGFPITRSGIHHLATGRTKIPSAATIYGLTRFFGVPADFFFNPDTRVQVRETRELLGRMRTDD